MSSISKPLVYVILANLGSPEAPTSSAVSVYLRDFLSDPRVVDTNHLWWKPVLKLIRLMRSPRVAKIYESVWTETGSPLIVLQEQLCRKLEVELAAIYHDYDIKVVSAMSYRQPNITKVTQEVFKAKPAKVVLIPMYPQFSSSTTMSVIDGFNRAYQDKNVRYIPPYSIINNYFRNPLYIKSLADSIRDKIKQEATTPTDETNLVEPKDYFSANNKLFLSFHGIPCRFVDPLGDPYEQHCQETVELLAQELSLAPEQYQLCYQSKFGRDPWLTPATDESLEKFARSTSDAKAMVICPGFSIDCIETLEEIEEENREAFMHAGGKHFTYVPCLNDSAAHVSLMIDLIAKEISNLA